MGSRMIINENTTMRNKWNSGFPHRLEKMENGRAFSGQRIANLESPLWCSYLNFSNIWSKFMQNSLTFPVFRIRRRLV